MEQISEFAVWAKNHKDTPVGEVRQYKRECLRRTSYGWIPVPFGAK